MPTLCRSAGTPPNSHSPSRDHLHLAPSLLRSTAWMRAADAASRSPRIDETRFPRRTDYRRLWSMPVDRPASLSHVL